MSIDPPIDPITLAVLTNRFVAAAREMTLTLERSGWTSIISLGHDFSCAIYDARLRQVAVYEALPLHTTAMHIALKTIVEHSAEGISDGDVFLMNDPHKGNTHVGDLVATCPVFSGGEVRFWIVTKAHQLDVGASIPSSVTPMTKDVWQEGIHIPPVRLYKEGVEQSDILSLYLNNVRYPDLLKGDLMAQLGSIWTGRARVKDILEEYGAENVAAHVDEMIAYASRRTAKAIQAMPDGEYTAEGWVDGDGCGRTNILIKTRVTIRGEEIEVDFSGSATQGEGGINGTLAVAMGAGAVPVLMALDPDIPHNQGCIDHIKVKVEHGSICWAKYPASTSAATLVPSDMMQDVVQKAMAGIVPDMVVAGTSRGANIPSIAGTSSDGEAWGAMLFNNLGGGGASALADGWPMIGTIGAWGGLETLPIEQLELLHPLRVVKWELETDSGGAGEFIGGPGNELVIQSLCGAITSVEFGDGRINPPHGVLGGLPGSGGGSFVQRANGARRYLSATNEVVVGDDELWCGVSSGGGGYGDPLARPADQVLRDLCDEVISKEVAETVYGLHLSAAGDIDVEGTVAKRSKLRSERGPVSLITPDLPAASTWLRNRIRDNDTFELNPRLN